MRKQFPGPLNVSWAQVSLLSVSDRQVSPEDIFFGHRSWEDDLKPVHKDATLTFRQSHMFSVFTLNSLNNRGWHQSTVTPISTSQVLEIINGIGYCAWFSTVLEIKVRALWMLGKHCTNWATTPNMTNFEMGFVLSLTTRYELQKQCLSSEVYSEAFVPLLFWKSGMSSVMTLYWKVIIRCLSLLRSWLLKQSCPFPYLRPKVFCLNLSSKAAHLRSLHYHHSHHHQYHHYPLLNSYKERRNQWKNPRVKTPCLWEQIEVSII